MSSNRSSHQKFNCLAIASPSFSKNKILVEEVRHLADRLIINSSGERLGEEQLSEFLKSSNADAVIIGTDSLTAKVIESAKGLRAVGKYGVGLERVDTDALRSKGIFFGYCAGVNRRSVSELILGFILGHQRNIFKSINRMQNGIWDKNGGSQLSEKTVGIVGFGNIGTDLANLLQPFGCKIIAHDVLDKSEKLKQFNGEQLSYRDLLQKADVISFSVPGDDSTKHMFGNNELTLVKPSALVINTARGSVVDFDSISSAVRTNRISGYASDVFPLEPLNSNDYKVEDGFYFTPHIGGNAAEAILQMGRAAIESLREFLASQDNPHVRR